MKDACDTCHRPHPKCNGHNQVKEPCKAQPIPGAEVCRWHGGRAPQVAGPAAVRAEIARWGLSSTPDVDPGEMLLRLLTQSSWRAERYSHEVARVVDQAETLTDALIGDQMVMDPKDGQLHKVSDYIKGLIKLEGEERDRCARFAKLALDAGLAERSVRLAERQGALIEQVLLTALGDPRLAMSSEQRTIAPTVITEALAVVTAA